LGRKGQSVGGGPGGSSHAQGPSNSRLLLANTGLPA
jgi:hypothetical protein